MSTPGRLWQPKKQHQPRHVHRNRDQHMNATHSQLSDAQQRVAANYNSRTACAANLEHRRRSDTVNIRDMNNWLKYVSITQCIWSAFEHNNGHKISVLDLGCGKGGDLYKMRGNKQWIASYVGVDFASECIESAKRKYRGMAEQQERHGLAMRTHRLRSTFLMRPFSPRI